MAQHGGSTIYQKVFPLFTTTFLLFLQDIGCPPLQRDVRRVSKKNNESSAQPKLQGRIITGRWPSHPTSWYLVKACSESSPAGWRRGPETKLIPWRRPAFLQVRDSSSGFFLTKKINPNGVKSRGFQLQVAMLLRRNPSVDIPIPPHENSVIMKNWQKKSETGSVCSMYGMVTYLLPYKNSHM